MAGTTDGLTHLGTKVKVSMETSLPGKDALHPNWIMIKLVIYTTGRGPFDVLKALWVLCYHKGVLNIPQKCTVVYKWIPKKLLEKKKEQWANSASKE